MWIHFNLSLHFSENNTHISPGWRCTQYLLSTSSFLCFSPNVMVTVATVLSCGQKSGCSTLKALQGQSPLTRSHVDFGKIHRTKLHPPDKVSCSVLCTQKHIQVNHSTVITLPNKCPASHQIRSTGVKTSARLEKIFPLISSQLKLGLTSTSLCC